MAPLLGLSVLVESGQWDSHSVIGGDEACSLPLPASVSLGSDVVRAGSVWMEELVGAASVRRTGWGRRVTRGFTEMVSFFKEETAQRRPRRGR